MVPTMFTIAFRIATVALPTLLIVAPACVGDFDLTGKIACRVMSDCAPGWVCVAEPDGPARCRPPGYANNPGEADGGHSAADGGGGGADALPEGCIDRDGDGVGTGPPCIPPFDCDDTRTDISPSLDESCNGRDDDCDGAVDNGFDLATDADHCGECGHTCFAAHSDVACVAEECVVLACENGFRDANNTGDDGCEDVCASAEISCTDGEDDDCDGAIDRDDPDCLASTPFAGRQYHLFAWDGDDVPSLRTGRAVFDEPGNTLSFQNQQITDLTRSGRGGPADTLLFDVSVVEPDRITLDRPGAPLPTVLHRSARAGTTILAGIQGGTTLLALVEIGATARPPTVRGEWLAWVVSPLNELEPVPGGIDELGWAEPTEIALLDFQAPDDDGVGEVHWPFSEFRTSLAGDPESESGLRDTSYTVRSDGAFALELFDERGMPEREFDGVVTAGGSLAIAVHRYSDSYCVSRWVPDGRCVHDPIAMFAVRRAETAGVAALEGQWRLVGVSYEERGGGLNHTFVSAALDINDAGRIGGDVSGQVRTFGAAETFVPETSRIDLSGSSLPGGGLVLEGHVAGAYGVFWDQSDSPNRRPMNGSVYLLLAQ